MADRSPPPQQVQVHPQPSRSGPSTSQILAIVTLLPVGGTLLCLAGLTLAGTLVGLAVTTPLFIIFSPVLVPAALAIGLAVTGFLGSGAFGLTGLSSLSWLLSYLRQASEAMPNQFEMAKKKAQDMAGYAGQKTKDLGQTTQTKAQSQETGATART